MAPIVHNYFTCTLGQAAERRKKHGDRVFETIIELIDVQAEAKADSPALGFADFNTQGSNHGELPRLFSILSLTHMNKCSLSDSWAMPRKEPLICWPGLWTAHHQRSDCCAPAGCSSL
jgi:hypothetical protein